MGDDLTSGSVMGTIMRASIPLVLAFLLQSSFNVVDAFFVGRLSSEALAAVSASFPIVFLTISIGTGIGVGATSVVARHIGAKKFKHADNAAEHAILVAFVLGALMTVICLIASSPLFDLLGVEGAVKSMGVGYLNIILLFTCIPLLTMVCGGILRAEGDMRTPMYVMGVSALLNAILDPIFIFSLGWGVAGAAWATVLTQALGLAYLSWHMLSGRSWIRLAPSDFSFDWAHVRSIFAVGIPSSISNVIMSVGMFFFTLIVGWHGTDALAAFGIGFRLDSLAILPAVGVSVALVSIVGQNVGAGKIERAREATLKAGLISCALMSAIGAVFYAFAPSIVSAFNSDPQVIAYGVSFLRVLPLSYLFVGMAICMTGAFLGSGHANLALIATSLRILLFSAPLAYLLSLSWGVEGIWWGIFAGSFLSFLVSVILFQWGGWDKSTH